MTFACSYFLLFCLTDVVTTFHQDNLDVFAKVLETLHKSHHSNIYIISDFKTTQPETLIKNLTHLQVPISTFSIEGLVQKESMRKEECPIYINYEDAETEPATYSVKKDSLVVRENILRQNAQMRLIVFWLQELPISDAINMLTESMMLCKQKIELGYLHPQTRIVFVTKNETERTEMLSHLMIQRHPYIASVELNPRGVLWYKDNDLLAELTSPSQAEKMNLKQLFPLPRDFHGRLLRIGAVHWAHYVLREIVNAQDAKQIKFIGDLWGFEVELISYLQQHFNFTVEPVVVWGGNWGGVHKKNGTWHGMVGNLVFDVADAIIGDCSMNYDRGQVIDWSNAYDLDYVGWVAPAPQPQNQSYLSLIRPLHPFVWMCALATLLLVGLVLNKMAIKESELMGLKCPPDWSTFSATSWYCFGSILGEAVTRDTRSEKYPALRIVLAGWILCSLIIGASYTGNLKAFLTTPTMSNPVDSLEAIVESGLEIGIVLHGGVEEEEQMAVSQDPILKQIWNRKKVIPQANVPDLSQVYEGKSIVMEWTSAMLSEIFMRFTNPGTEEPLIYVSDKPVISMKPSAMMVNKLMLCTEQFDKIIRDSLERGLTEYWIRRTLRQMKKNMLLKGKQPVEVYEPPLISPLSLHNLQAPVGLLGLILIVAVIVFLYEMFGDKLRMKQKVKKEQPGDSITQIVKR